MSVVGGGPDAMGCCGNYETLPELCGSIDAAGADAPIDYEGEIEVYEPEREVPEAWIAAVSLSATARGTASSQRRRSASRGRGLRRPKGRPRAPAAKRRPSDASASAASTASSTASADDDATADDDAAAGDDDAAAARAAAPAAHGLLDFHRTEAALAKTAGATKALADGAGAAAGNASIVAKAGAAGAWRAARASVSLLVGHGAAKPAAAAPPRHVGHDAKETQRELSARLGRHVSMVETQEKMLHIGTNESGCVSEADIAELVDRERKKPLRRRARITLARSLVPSNVRLLYNSMRCPKEVYAATVVADRDVLVAPLPKPTDVDWASLVLLDPPSFSRALDTLTNAMLTQTTHAAHATLGLGDHAPGRNSLLMYLAQQGDVDQVRDIFATRPIVRSIVDLRNTLGYAAIDYALANDHQEVYDIFLSYHREHLAHHSINSKLRHNLDNGGSRFAARGGRWELRE